MIGTYYAKGDQKESSPIRAWSAANPVIALTGETIVIGIAIGIEHRASLLRDERHPTAAKRNDFDSVPDFDLEGKQALCMDWLKESC